MHVAEIQKKLVEAGVDGWLLYDFHHSNPLAHQVLAISAEKYLTRRFFYWIPAQGEPVKILHAIEAFALDHLPGEERLYLKWQTLHAQLKQVLQGARRVAMEHSPHCSVPYVSLVDGGTIDLVRSFGVEVVSSAAFLQFFTCVWSPETLSLHLEAAGFLDKTAAGAFALIADALASGREITEYAVQQWIYEQIVENGFCTGGFPICGVNAHSADPHYAPQKSGSSAIRRGDFIQIDLWCKKNLPGGVYADISRVAVADARATEKQEEVFRVVRSAQQRATDFVREAFAKGEPVRGCAVDQVCREVIADAGYGANFIHRTGHNVHTEAHGPGANIDSLETYDERLLIPMTCFTLEPAIYLPGEFGIRLEYDVVIDREGTLVITGGVQEEIKKLF